MGDFLSSLHDLCVELMPILGAICLIVVVIILIKLVKILESVNVTINKTHPSIDLVEKSLDKVQAPLDTTVKLAKSVDKAYDVGAKVVDEASEFVTKNAVVIKNKINDYLKKNEDKNESIEDSEYTYVEEETEGE